MFVLVVDAHVHRENEFAEIGLLVALATSSLPIGFATGKVMATLVFEILSQETIPDPIRIWIVWPVTIGLPGCVQWFFATKGIIWVLSRLYNRWLLLWRSFDEPEDIENQNTS